MTKQSFEAKMKLVVEAIAKQLTLEGTNVVGLEDEIAKIAKGYMLVEQCIWYRLKDDKALTNLLVKFEAITQKAMPLIEKHGFENLVFTFRSKYTNLYQVSGGKGRHYNLSSKDYDEFINGVDDGSIQVLTRVSTSKPKASKQPKVVAPSNFMSNLLKQVNPTVKPTTLVVAKAQPKVETPKVEKQPKVVAKSPKVATKVAKVEAVATPSTKLIHKHDDKFLQNLIEKPIAPTTTKGSWVEHDIQKSMLENTFIKVLLKDGDKAFGKFKYVSYLKDKEGNPKNNVVVVTMAIKGQLYDIELTNIDKVYTYQK